MSTPPRRLLGLVLALLASCVSPPAASVRSTFGVVRAPTAPEARDTADLLDEYVPRLAEVLPGTRLPEVEVWVQDELRVSWFGRPAKDVVALNYPSWERIHLLRRSRDLAPNLVHELVHMMIDDSWHGLPPALEEGLCDHVALGLVPRDAARFRAGRLSRALLGIGTLRGEVALSGPGGIRASVGFRLRPERGQTVTPADVLRPNVGEISPFSQSGNKGAYYGLGYLVVERIVDRHGYGGLHALCRDGEATAEEVLRAADLDLDPRTWIRAIHETLGPEELRILAEEHGGEFAKLVTERCRELHPRCEGPEVVEGSRPVLRVDGVAASVPLTRVRSFQSALRELFPIAIAP